MRRHITLAGGVALLAALDGAARTASAQALDVPLTPARWAFSGDSSRFQTFLGRPSLRVGRGVAIARDIDFRNGTIEFDLAGDSLTPYLGVLFHARDKDDFEDIFFRIGASGTIESVQYAPCLNGENGWEIVHGPDANAAATLTRNQWMHVKLVLAGDTATIYLGADTAPVLIVPHLTTGFVSGGIGFWTGPFGRGGYFSNLRYTVDPSPHAPPPHRELAAGTLADWDLSEEMDGATMHPGVLPTLSTIDWEHVHAEPGKAYHDKALGLVLINRYRRGANVGPPADSATGMELEDSIMGGHVTGTKVVLARAVIDSDRDRIRRLHFGYANGVVVYLNGRPLFFGANPFGLRDLGGVMERTGEALYLPLHKGRNEIVLAVTDYFAGWGFWTRLEN